MEFRVEKEDIIKALSKVQGVVGKKGTIPILSNVLIKSYSGDRIEILATDLEISIRTFCEGKILSEGAITLAGRKLYEIVRELPQEIITFKEKGNGVEISCGRVVYNLPTLPSQEFPKISFFEGDEVIRISSEVLYSMIEKTVFAIPKEPTQYILNGFFIEESEGLLSMVATDGYRLALIKGEFMGGGIREGVLIPKRAFVELRRLMDLEDEGILRIGFKENMSIINLSNTTLLTRLIEGEFPDYKQVIFRERNNVVRINKEDFKKALKRISLVSDEREKIVKFYITQDKFIISSEYPVGEAREEIDIHADIESDFHIIFNSTYFLDVLNVIDEEEVVVEFEDEETSSLLRPLNDQNYINVIMPIRL